VESFSFVQPTAPFKEEKEQPTHESVGVDGKPNRISENVKIPVIERIEVFPSTDASEMRGYPSPSNASKAVPVLATLFAITIVGSAVFILSKKYPEMGRHLHGALDRVNILLRVARGEDLVDIVSEIAPGTHSKQKSAAENRDVGLARKDSFGSAKSSVTFAKDLETVFAIPSIPVRRSVSFADSMGGELATELGPGPINSLDEIDDYLESSSRSSADEDIDSSGSSSAGTFDSADDSIESDSGRITLRAHVGGNEMEISWDDAV